MTALAILAAALLWGVTVAWTTLEPGPGPAVSPEYLGAGLLFMLALAVGGLRLWQIGGRFRVLAGILNGGGVAVLQLLTLAGFRGIAAFDPPWAASAILATGVGGGILARAIDIRFLPGARWPAIVFALSLLEFAHEASSAGLAGSAAPCLLWSWLGFSMMGFAVFGGFVVGSQVGRRGRERPAADERFRTLAEVMPIPIVLTAVGNNRFLFANERARRELRLANPAEQDIAVLFADPEDQPRLAALMRRDGALDGREVELCRTDSTRFWALLSARAVSFDGRAAVVTAFTDITDRKAAEEELMASEVRYALISRASSDGIWDWDIPSGQVYFSARWREIVGAESSRKLFSLDDWLSRLHPEDIDRVRREIDDHVAGLTLQLDTEYRIRHGDGRYLWMQCRGIALRNNQGEPIRMAGSQSDITLRKTYEINLLNAAYEDHLTGLNNRAYFEHLVDTRSSERDIEASAILLFNLDRFRRVNDNLGSAAGDALLITTARRLAAKVGPADALSRLGADEFAIWVQDVPTTVAVAAIADAFLVDLTRPSLLGDVEIPLSLSVGYAMPLMGDCHSGLDLMRNARLALDRAKALGGGRVEAFHDDMLRETNLRRRLSQDLTSAEQGGQISFEYQAVVALEPNGVNRIAGFESLMRWQHPELGRISPVRFIPIAEESGMIGPLGLHAIESAAAEIGAWSEQGLIDDKFSIAVNLSARQISDRAGVLRLNALLDRLRLPPGRLKLEITESVLMSDPETMAQTLQDIRLRGVGLSLDDFGTGYSSLSYLHRFPLDILKIDRSFISRMGRAPEAARLVNSIIELAHDLGLSVVAEGIETAEDIERLRDLGCDYGQGYYFSRPVPVSAARELLIRGRL